MNYREQVQRMISIHHARLELGLSKAREQEAFVARVCAILTRNQISHRLGINPQFDVVIKLPEHIIHAENLLHTLFSGCLLERDSKGWVLSNTPNDYLQIRLIGDDNGL